MIRWLLFFLTLGSATFGQQVVESRIVDAETGQPIPFASIGIVGTSKGTSSNINGQFSLSVSGSVKLKITCLGYESFLFSSSEQSQVIRLKPVATQLNGIFVFDKAVNPKKIVRKAFAHISDNYISQPFIESFFYRHYCKDDSIYGRLIEASVDILKHDGYRSVQKSVGEKEEIRITQLRRSLDKTTMAQGHEPISIKNILQADVVGYQTADKSEHLSFYNEVSNLQADFENYSFAFKGITTYDGQEVYEITFSYKKDSVLTTSGKYLELPQSTGSLFITTDSYAFVKTEEEKLFGPNRIRSSAYYRKVDGHYYPYHLVREGSSRLAENSTHSFRIDLMSVDVQTAITKKFTGSIPGKDELLNIPYDSTFWKNNTVLKTTPLEEKIIYDLGGGASLNKQFLLYRQYENNLKDGGRNGEQKFNWLREDSKGKRILYLYFWSENFRPYVTELELAKRLHKQYRNQITFVLLSLDDDETRWQQALTKYNFNSDGLINYRIGGKSEIQKSLHIKEIPACILISQQGEIFDLLAKHPGNPLLEKDFRFLLKQSR